MRWVRTILGIMMVMAGEVWLLQGLGKLPGSFMTGSSFWAAVGTVLIVGGIVVLLSLAR
ncbi:MAG TPA: hypothetical protein VFW01_03725 [bacterium]|nr:hypothetical protein [bacterium]